LREVGLVGDTNQLDESMPTVSELAQLCRFSDCSHAGEPGCAVLAAIESGGLDEAEFDTYNKLARELAYTERKNDRRLAALERKRWKQIEMNNRRDMRRR
jgi:ribosome biogenesis GTPase